MKTWHNNLLVAFVLSAVLFGCGGAKKAEPVAITGFETYKDESLSFGLKFPSNWMLRKQSGSQAVAFSTNNGIERFSKYDTEGVAGAKISITAIKTDGKPLDQVVADSKVFTAESYSAPEKVTIDGIQGTKLGCSFDLTDGKFQSEKYFAMKDSMYVTVVELSAFGSTFDSYRKSFDEIIASITLATAPAPKEVKIDTVSSEPAPPSETMRSISGNGFSISVPDNFTGARTTVKGTLASASYVGDRRDCTIQVDVFDASKQKNLDKIVADNKARYKATATNSTTLGGAKAYSINYSFVKDVNSRVYFTIKGEKMFRVTLNWFKPKESAYLPIFEKSVSSFKFD